MSTSGRGCFSAVIRRKTAVSPTCSVLVLERPDRFPEARPGQFVSIRVSDTPVPLLRRPYSIMDLTPKTLSLLVKVAGRGSAAIAAGKRGDTIDIMGPLGGSSFPEPEWGAAVLVAGGTGLAPLLFAVRAWRRNRVPAKTVLLYGAGNRSELLRDLVKGEFSACRFATLDGSSGFRGDVVALCRQLVRTKRLSDGTLYSCGPRAMIRALEGSVRGAFRAHYTSLESVMACGVGACRGCAVPVRGAGAGAIKTVCSDGTVFRAEDIVWEEWEG
jgi:dihydroorotate dehydrogenase electron transfer subunit